MLNNLGHIFTISVQGTSLLLKKNLSRSNFTINFPSFIIYWQRCFITALHRITLLDVVVHECRTIM
jgi:hypothetical protein